MMLLELGPHLIEKSQTAQTNAPSTLVSSRVHNVFQIDERRRVFESAPRRFFCCCLSSARTRDSFETTPESFKGGGVSSTRRRFGWESEVEPTLICSYNANKNWVIDTTKDAKPLYNA